MRGRASALPEGGALEDGGALRDGDFASLCFLRAAVATWVIPCFGCRFGTLAAARTFPCDKARPAAMSTKRTRFVQDAKLDPGRYYRHPADIIRDRRLTKEDRLEIVIAWEHGTQQLLAS